MDYATLMVYFDKDSRVSSFLHRDEQSAVNGELEELFQKRCSLKTNVIWQGANVDSSDRVTVFITMDRKYGSLDIGEDVQKIFEKAPSTNKETAQRTVIVYF